MNAKTTVILLLLLLVCIGYVIVVQMEWFSGDDNGEKPVDRKGERLFEGVDSVRRFSLEAPRTKKIVLAKREDKWRLLEPVDAPAVGWQCDSTVSNFTGLKIVRQYPPDDADRPTDDITSLSAPTRTVAFTDEKGKHHTLCVGRQVPMTPRRCYVQLDGDDNLYVVDADLNERLNKKLKDYRETALTKFDTDKAVRVEVRGEQKYQLVKVDDKWAVDKPVDARADQDKVKDLLRKISDVDAQDFAYDAPENLAGFGLKDPRLQVTVELAPPEPTATPATKPGEPPKPKKGDIISVAFGAPAEDEKIFAKLADKPWVFLVRKDVLKDLQPKLLDLRDRKVLNIAGQEATRIEISLVKEGDVTLEKVDDAWRMAAPFKGAAEGDAVTDLLSLLRDDLKAEEFQDKPTSVAAYGLKPPKGKIVLHFRGSAATTTLLLGDSSGSGQMGFVQPANSKSVAVVPSADFAKLLVPAAAYWKKTLLELPAGAEVTQVNVDRPGRKKYVVEVKDDKYTLSKPLKAPGDEENVKALIDAVKTLEADKIIALDNTLAKRFVGLKPIRVSLAYRTELPPEPPASQPATASAPASGPASAPATRPASAPATKPAEPVKRYQPGKTPVLLVVKDKDKSYVWVEGAKPVAVGELGEDFHEKLAAELRDRTILKIDTDKIVSFITKTDELELKFDKAGDVWECASDTLVKVDKEKIEELLKTLSEIKATRFVDHAAKPRLAKYGLDKPTMVIELGTDEGKPKRLEFSRTGPVGENAHYAVSSDVPGVFVLGPEEPEKLLKKKLDDFKKSE